MIRPDTRFSKPGVKEGVTNDHLANTTTVPTYSTTISLRKYVRTRIHVRQVFIRQQPAKHLITDLFVGDKELVQVSAYHTDSSQGQTVTAHHTLFTNILIRLLILRIESWILQLTSRGCGLPITARKLVTACSACSTHKTVICDRDHQS